MHAATLFLTRNEARDPQISSKMDGELPAIDAEGVEYLNGQRLYHGDAADYVEQIAEDVHIDDGIYTSRDEVISREAIEFYADVSTDPGFIGVSSASKGEWFVKRVAAKTGVEAMETCIDVDAFAERIREDDEAAANAWNVSRQEDYGPDLTETSIDYNRSADLETAVEGTIGLGFEYFWEDSRFRGVLYESGYVALYTDTVPIVFGRWLQDEIVPHLYVPDVDEDEEAQLTEDEQDRAEVAATDGGDDDQQSLDDLETVNDPSGGDD